MSEEEDFAAMFEASEKARRFERGQTVEGIVVAFGEEVAFVSIGGKSEAQIDIAELKDANGVFDVSVGDRIHAKIVSTSGGIVLSRKGVRNAATQRELEDAFNADRAYCSEFDPDQYAARNRLVRFLESVVRLFAPLCSASCEPTRHCLLGWPRSSVFALADPG